MLRLSWYRAIPPTPLRLESQFDDLDWDSLDSAPLMLFILTKTAHLRSGSDRAEYIDNELSLRAEMFRDNSRINDCGLIRSFFPRMPRHR